jgi:predicted dehydrogenase
MINIALAGFSQGYYAINYTRYLSKLKNINIIAVCDFGRSDTYVKECAFITADDFAKELNSPLIHSYQDLLRMKPDAVLICEETHLHSKLAKEAILAGSHVFVSKPLCFSKDDILTLRGVNASGKKILCGNPLKYDQGIDEIKGKIASGIIGELYSFRIMINHLAMVNQEWERDTSKSGGPFGTYSVYLFDLAKWLTNEKIVELYGFADNFSTPLINSPDTFKIIGKGEKGSQFTFELFSAIISKYPFIVIEAIGKLGTIISKYDNYSSVTQTTSMASLGELRLSCLGTLEIDHFLSCIIDDESEKCSYEDMTYVVDCIEASLCSFKTNKTILIGKGG